MQVYTGIYVNLCERDGNVHIRANEVMMRHIQLSAKLRLTQDYLHSILSECESGHPNDHSSSFHRWRNEMMDKIRRAKKSTLMSLSDKVVFFSPTICFFLASSFYLITLPFIFLISSSYSADDEDGENGQTVKRGSKVTIILREGESVSPIDGMRDEDGRRMEGMR